MSLLDVNTTNDFTGLEKIVSAYKASQIFYYLKNTHAANSITYRWDRLLGYDADNAPIWVELQAAAALAGNTEKSALPEELTDKYTRLYRFQFKSTVTDTHGTIRLISYTIGSGAV